MSTHQQQHQILQTCHHINQLLSIPSQSFSLQSLTHIDWYLTVLELIYPQLADRFEQIKRIENQATAIDKLLYMLTKEEIIEEDFLQIKGEDIVEGDVESVYYVVQLLSALIQREGQQGQQEGQAQEDGQEGEAQEQQDNQQPDHHSSAEHEQQYSNDFQQPLDSSNNNSPQKPTTIPSPPAQSLPKPIHNNDMFKNVFNHYDSQDEPSRQEQRHSVLGIQNQFEDQQDQEEGEDEENIRQQLSSGGKNSGNNATFGQQQQSQSPSHMNPQQSLSKPTQQTSNIFSNLPQKPHTQLVSTGYKMTQQPKKQFPSSSSQQVNFYEQPSRNQYENQGKKVSKPSKPSKGSKEETEQEDDNEYFINPTIKKYKSDPKLLKTVGSASKKSTTKKNLAKYASPIAASKQSRKLVSHPTIKKQYRKAANPEAKKLTQQVKTQASVILKKKKPLEPSNIANPAGEEMQRKVKQLKVKLADWKKDSKMQQKRKLKASSSQTKSSIQLTKVLNWRQGQLKREKQQFQKAMQMKLQVQKQSYIKKINTLLIKLQKQKQLHERQQYKEHLIKENHEAAKRLTAIEHWYKDRIAMLKQSNSENRNERKLMHTGHKEILKHIEKELKRENQKQIMAITMKYRRQQAQVENDLEQLQREIVKVYKKH